VVAVNLYSHLATGVFFSGEPDGTEGSVTQTTFKVVAGQHEARVPGLAAESQ
tara:strand:+ start:29 stop:184 length:156 start_codon:yes stop_codon:yes gene_type:complete